MIVKQVKYTDFNGDERVEDCYFNINETELFTLKQEMGEAFDTMSKYSNTTVPEEVNDEIVVDIVKTYKKIISVAYGIKSDDGRSFIKNVDGVSLGEQFISSMAFDTLFMELFEDKTGTQLSNFIKGIFPKKYHDDMTKQQIAMMRQNQTPSISQ